MGTGLILRTANLSVTSRRESTGLSTVTLCHRCFSAQSEFTHGGRVGSSFMPKSNPARGHVLSLVLRTMKYTRSKGNNKTSRPSVISIHFTLSLCLHKHVSTNIISVQCHYCEIAAGIVSPAHFPASITHSST